MPIGSLLSLRSAYLRAAIRPSPKRSAADGDFRSAHRSELNGRLHDSPLRRSWSRLESRAGAKLSVPLEFPSFEAMEGSPENPQLAFDPAFIPADAEQEPAAVLNADSTPAEEDFPALPAPDELARIQLKIVNEISAAIDSHLEEQNARETSGSAELAPESPKNLFSHFGLRQQPFDVTPDPAYLYPNPSHREALAALKQGIEYFRGFMLLAAEPGMGKTTLLHRLMDELSTSARVVFLFQTQCTSRELLSYILNELEVDHAGMDAVAMHRALNQALLEEMLRGRRFVLIVDEAQNLEAPALETLRLLSDFETTHSKLIQIVLAGQPQIAETLMKPGLLQLRQRISVLTSLKPLGAAEVSAYVEHRLRVSGWNGSALFTSEAVAQLAAASGGVPRSINNLCFSALLEAYERGLETIDAEMVKAVAARLDLASVLVAPETEAPTAEEPSEKLAEPIAEPKATTEAVLTGTLTEKVRGHGWSKKPEYRILITLEHDPMTGVAVADRYYCASLYVDEAKAAALQTGKPVRIIIDQE